MREAFGSTGMLSRGPALLPGYFGYHFRSSYPPGWNTDAKSNIPSPQPVVFGFLFPGARSPCHIPFGRAFLTVYHPVILVSLVKGFTPKALNRSGSPRVLAEPLR